MKVKITLPSGEIMEYDDVKQAAAALRLVLDERDCLWIYERDFLTSYQRETLRETVKVALPNWEEYGLPIEIIALLLQTVGSIQIHRIKKAPHPEIPIGWYRVFENIDKEIRQ